MTHIQLHSSISSSTGQSLSPKPRTKITELLFERTIPKKQILSALIDTLGLLYMELRLETAKQFRKKKKKNLITKLFKLAHNEPLEFK